ncbi:amidohydrolase family protein [Rhodoplanes serenus]|uniref:5-methylthioadenosine/S-adenosylhomocysteine deaminase n=1 Tax=Rhodoplanes serenus TaxID=200615 RepID=A0A447CQ21_9BRAD|nr:amidohydrolase family protein [Rhodoplanes serenus]MTW18623.1 amidohydrolase family protein [Rhodoplanes serenus]VCU07270.1 5-methylthioadenosine/S-adenosylhomocysteine deaminase [Rhodoplanes serenus]
MSSIIAAHALDAGGCRRDIAIEIEGETIARIHPATAPADDVIVMPAFANAHDHARPMPPSAVGAFGKPLELWLNRLAMFTAVDPYLATLAPFARAALGGQAAAMVHHTRPMGLTDLPTEAAEIARAAKDVGLRIAFGVALRDQNPLVYGDPAPVLADLDPVTRAEIEGRFLGPMKPIAEQIAVVDAVAERIASPMVDVQYAPNGPQWCSKAMWEALAEASARTGRRITTHLFETRYQRAWADRNFPQGLVRWLKDIGILSPRLTVAHCVWIRPDELDLLAEAGCTIATNPSSNLMLRSGIAPVADMVRRGCTVAMGLDGQTFDEDDDALREARLLWSLQAGWGFDTELTPAQVLTLALENGRPALRAPAGGRLAEGAAADLLIVDRAALEEPPVDEVAPIELLFARATRRHVKGLIVAGRTVVRDGRLLGVDLEAAHKELAAAYRAGLAQRSGLRAALPALEASVARYYGARLGCC